MREEPHRVIRRVDMAVTGVALAAAVALFLGWEQKVAGRWGFPLDDTWIHMQFARNLFAGQGFAFNPGEPISASSAPLWTVTLSLLYFLPWDVVLSAKALGALLLWASGLLTILLARSVGLEARWALLGGLTVVLTPRLLWGSLSGMEVTFYAALATGGVWLHLHSWRRAPSLAGTALLALASLARPECLILFPLAVLDRWRSTRNLKQLAHLYWKHVLLFGALLAPMVLFSYRTIGLPLPNTFYAKVGTYGLIEAILNFDAAQMAKAILLYPVLQARELLQFSVENNLLLTCLAPLGVLEMVRVKHGRHSRGSWLVPLILLGFPIARGMLAPFKGPTFQHGRYAAYLVPLLTVAGLVGLRAAARMMTSNLEFSSLQRLRRWGRPLVWGIVLWNLLVLDLKYARTYARNVDDINDVHVEMGRWLAQHIPARALVATHDIGAIGYFSGRRVLDTTGLITPAVLDYLHRGIRADAAVLQFLQRRRPDYLVVLPNWYPHLAAQRQYFQPVHEVAAAAGTIVGGRRFVAYRTIWADQ